MEGIEKSLLAAVRDELGAMDLTKIEVEETNDDFFEWWMYEWGLDVLFPFHLDEKIFEPDENKSSDAKIWDAIRGSKLALKLALEWIGFENSKIETFGSTPSFFRYQIQINRDNALDDDDIKKIKDISMLSSAHRDVLYRIYRKEFDIRNMVLGSASLGNSMLSDYSGKLKDGVKQALSKEDIQYG